MLRPEWQSLDVRVHDKQLRGKSQSFANIRHGFGFGVRWILQHFGRVFHNLQVQRVVQKVIEDRGNVGDCFQVIIASARVVSLFDGSDTLLPKFVKNMFDVSNAVKSCNHYSKGSCQVYCLLCDLTWNERLSIPNQAPSHSERIIPPLRFLRSSQRTEIRNVHAKRYEPHLEPPPEETKL